MPIALWSSTLCLLVLFSYMFKKSCRAYINIAVVCWKFYLFKIIGNPIQVLNEIIKKSSFLTSMPFILWDVLKHDCPLKWPSRHADNSTWTYHLSWKMLLYSIRRVKLSIQIKYIIVFIIHVYPSIFPLLILLILQSVIRFSV